MPDISSRIKQTHSFCEWHNLLMYFYLTWTSTINQKSKFIFTSLFDQLMVSHKLIRAKLIRMGSGQVFQVFFFHFFSISCLQPHTDFHSFLLAVYKQHFLPTNSGICHSSKSANDCPKASHQRPKHI